MFVLIYSLVIKNCTSSVILMFPKPLTLDLQECPHCKQITTLGKLERHSDDDCFNTMYYCSVRVYNYYILVARLSQNLRLPSPSVLDAPLVNILLCYIRNYSNDQLLYNDTTTIRKWHDCVAPNFDGGNIEEFYEFPVIFRIKIFHLANYSCLLLMNLWGSGSTQNKNYISEAPSLENHNIQTPKLYT